MDFGASDAPQKPEFLTEKKLLQFPAVIGGVILVVNLADVKTAGQLKLDSDTIANIFLGKIKYWDDAAIKNLNSDLNLPHAEISAVYRSDGSGTTAIFTNYLNTVNNDWKNTVGTGTSVKFPVGVGGKGNEGVANIVQNTKNSIGYVELAYAKQNNLVFTQIKNAAGNFVSPSFESFEDAASTADFDPSKGFYLWLVNAPGKNAWPIAGATFILLAKDKPDSNAKVVKFFEWAFQNGDAKAKELIYVPLPSSLKDKVRAYWKSNGIQ